MKSLTENEKNGEIVIPKIRIKGNVSSYCVGKLIGRHKLAPLISPHKTWEGFIGGSILCSLFCTLIYLKGDFSLLVSIKFLSVSIVAHLGDLIESYAKRHLAIKDFGSSIPGHGGFLDRFDSFLAVSIVMGFIF